MLTAKMFLFLIFIVPTNVVEGFIHAHKELKCLIDFFLKKIRVVTGSVIRVGYYLKNEND